jgi:hypothetical protein
MQSCLPVDFMVFAVRAWCLPYSSWACQSSSSNKLRSLHAISGKFPLFLCSAGQTSPLSSGQSLISDEAMAAHSRRHSRGSIFSFTIDAVRSLSHVGSRQGSSKHSKIWSHSLHDGAAIRVEDEDQSPAVVLPVSDESQTYRSGRLANTSSSGPLAPPKNNVPLNSTKTRMPRPLSWLPTPRSRKNKVGRSISAPVLKSTTNANVARVEGVRCGELTQADLIQSTWSPQAGWVPDSSISAEHIEKAVKAAEVTNKIEGGAVSDTDRLKSEDKKPRTATLSRLKGTIRGHLDSMTVTRRPALSDRSQFSKLEEGSISSTARRRAEGISLCKQKIRNLTGHGNVKRKPIEKDPQLSAKNIGERHHEEQPLLMSTSMSSPGRLDITGEYTNLSRGYTFGDLEKSFTNAVDKLEFHQTPQQSPDGMANPNRQSLLPGLYQQDPNITDTRRTTTVNKAGIHTSRPEPCTFSVSQASLIPTPNNERRPKVNPLKCHPNVSGFAEQLVDTSEVSTPPMGTSTPRIEITKEEVEGLNDAPIYSPSSGNLSQYARLTPSPARSTASSFHTAPLLTPGNLHEVPYYTPTRPSGRSAAAEHAAHQRRGEMIARRSNPQLFSDYEQARMKENRRNATPMDIAMKSKTTGTVGVGGKAIRTESPKMQQKPQASGMDGQELAQQEEEAKETLEWSPYRVGDSKRIIGWAPLPSSPGYRYAPPGRTTYDFVSNEHLPSPTTK